MPLQQFDERVLLLQDCIIDDTYTPNTWVNLSGRGAVADNRADVVMLANSDTVDHVVEWTPWVDVGDAWCEITVPAGAGFGAIPPVDVLAVAMPSAYHYSLTPAGSAMAIRMQSTPASGKIVRCWSMGGSV